jgi:hypothetical protein
VGCQGLHLGWNPLGGDGATALVAILAALPSLGALTLAGCALSQTGPPPDDAGKGGKAAKGGKVPSHTGSDCTSSRFALGFGKPPP